MRRHTWVSRFALVLSLVATSVAAGPSTNAPPPVLIPVILDGVRYDADRFNALNISLSRGVDLHFAFFKDDQSVVYAFTARADVIRFLDSQQSRPSASGGRLARPNLAPRASNGCPYHADPVYSVFFEDINCGGARLPVYPGATVSSLQSWNDILSSGVCSPYYEIQSCALFEHVNYGGASLWFSRGQGRNDFSLSGWNDRASSLIVYTQSQ